MLAPRGAYILVGGSGTQFLQLLLLGPWRSRKSGQRFKTFVKQPTQANLAFVKGLLEAPEALRYLKAGHTTGKVVITLGQGERTE